MIAQHGSSSMYEYHKCRCDLCKQGRHERHISNKIKFNALLARLKDVPCVDCGIKYPPYVMDFDHVKGTKLFTVSQRNSRPLEQVLKEVVKCEVRCSNCHRIKTHKDNYNVPQL